MIKFASSHVIEYSDSALTKLYTLGYFSLLSWFLLGVDTTEHIVQAANLGKEGTNIETPINR